MNKCNNINCYQILFNYFTWLRFQSISNDDFQMPSFKQWIFVVLDKRNRYYISYKKFIKKTEILLNDFWEIRVSKTIHKTVNLCLHISDYGDKYASLIWNRSTAICIVLKHLIIVVHVLEATIVWMISS